MKQILIALIVILGVGGVAFVTQFFGEVNYDKKDQVEAEKEVQIVERIQSEVDQKIKEAQEAAKGSIEEQAKKAYDASVEQGLLDIEIKVRDQYILDQEKINNEKKKQSVSH